MSTIVKLQSSDGKIFCTDIKIAKTMKTVGPMLKNLGPDEICLLAKVDSTILEMVLTWAEHHKDEDMETVVTAKPFTIPEWDKNFLKLNQETLSKLMIGSHYLNIEPLYKTCWMKVANMLRAKTTKQIRRILNKPKMWDKAE